MLKSLFLHHFQILFDNFFKDSVSDNSAIKFLPKVDIAEDEKKYEIHLAVPGINKENIKIDLEDGKLTISGERKFEKTEDGKKYHTVETQYGAFKRSFYLPDKASNEGIDAEYNNGILTVHIPKDEKKLAKTAIQIK
jgi:HSP20 family protein